MAAIEADIRAGDETHGMSRYEERIARGKRPLSLEFPTDLYERARLHAEKEERSLAGLVRVATEDYLRRHRRD